MLVNVVNESGRHNPILRSDKPEAEAFKWWITNEVLPREQEYWHVRDQLGDSGGNARGRKHPDQDRALAPEANAIIPFTFATYRIRVIMLDGKPWWVAKDVCAVLGYQDSDDAVRRHCKYAKLLKPGETPGLNLPPRGLAIIPESDLYRLMMRSNLPDAEKFQDWVVEEVLPQVRKIGGYAIAPVTVEKLLAYPDLLIKLATRHKTEWAKRLEVEEDQCRWIDATTCNDMQHLGWKLQERCGSMTR